MQRHDVAVACRHGCDIASQRYGVTIVNECNGMDMTLLLLAASWLRSRVTNVAPVSVITLLRGCHVIDVASLTRLNGGPTTKRRRVRGGKRSFNDSPIGNVCLFIYLFI